MNNALNSIELAPFAKSLGEVARVRSSERDGDRVAADIEFGVPIVGLEATLEAAIAGGLAESIGAVTAQLTLSSRIRSHAVQGNLKPVAGIRNVIAIASGKGGVGKSTVATNVALALAHAGAAVGMLDADIYGPSQPQMLGLAGAAPVSEDGKTMQALEAHGIKVMSIGFLVDPDQPMVWRGPMVTSALNQLMHQTNWGELDYLIVDMPPGTGDIQLTLAQKVPVSGAVIVTTPQNIATLDARRGLAMFRKVSIPVLGVVENMAMHVCPACGHEDAVFGTGGAADIVEDFGVPLLGRLPLETAIREQSDAGEAIVVAAPDSAAAAAFRRAALRIAAEQAVQRSDYSAKFGNIVVEGA